MTQLDEVFTLVIIQVAKASTTKKEHILQVAQRDPFLSVEEIASTCETTPRYVRTILSEARLSLMNLRRHYARKMERRLGVNVTVDRSDQSLSDALSMAGNRVGVNRIQMVKVTEPEISRILGVSPMEPLLKVSRVRLVNGRPFFVNELITHKDLVVGEDMVSSEKPLRQLLGLEVAGETSFVDRSLEVEPAPAYIAGSLGLAEGSPVIKSGNVIETRGERVGIEFNYFNAYAVRFTFPGLNVYALKIEEKVDG